MNRALIRALRARRVDVVTAAESGMIGKSDEEHLRRATDLERTLYSFNIGDYSTLHTGWLSAGAMHGGIVIAIQQRFSIGDQLRRLLRLVNERTPETMRGALEYMSSWGP